MALTQAQKRLLESARSAANELDSDGGRELVPLIGELTACEKLDLTWEPSKGYDAKADQERVQIKTRKSWSTPEVNPRGRLGRFGRKEDYFFDVAVYVELDDDFNLANLWRMGRDEVRALEGRESANRALHVSTFRNKAEKLE
jgi:hypothetical protein